MYDYNFKFWKKIIILFNVYNIFKSKFRGLIFNNINFVKTNIFFNVNITNAFSFFKLFCVNCVLITNKLHFIFFLIMFINIETQYN